jgi:membrane protease YdiL (CAAX protease family)
MPESPWFVVILAVLSVVCLRAWIGFFHAMAAEPKIPDDKNPMVSRYGLPDVVFAGFLCLFFVLMILSDNGEPQVVTRQILINGMLFYLSLVIAMASFLLLRGINPLDVYGLWPTNNNATDPKIPDALENTPAFLAETALPARRSLPSGILFGLLWLALGYPILMLVQAVSYHIAGLETPPQEILLFLLDHPDFADRFTVLALAIFVAPVAEEFIFRGYLYGVMRKYGGRWCAIGTTSLLFAAIHLHAPSFAGLFILGCLLAVVYERTGRLWVPIFMHMTFNAVSVAVALLWPDMMP